MWRVALLATAIMIAAVALTVQLQEWFEPLAAGGLAAAIMLPFALSIAIEFDCYLIDEVIMVGDQRFHARCREHLFDRRADRALVLASHDAAFIREVCDAAIVLAGARARWYGNVDEAIHAYFAL